MTSQKERKRTMALNLEKLKELAYLPTSEGNSRNNKKHTKVLSKVVWFNRTKEFNLSKGETATVTMRWLDDGTDGFFRRTKVPRRAQAPQFFEPIEPGRGNLHSLLKTKYLPAKTTKTMTDYVIQVLYNNQVNYLTIEVRHYPENEFFLFTEAALKFSELYGSTINDHQMGGSMEVTFTGNKFGYPILTGITLNKPSAIVATEEEVPVNKDFATYARNMGRKNGVSLKEQFKQLREMNSTDSVCLSFLDQWESELPGAGW